MKKLTPLIMAFMLAALPAHADDDHDRARRAVELGQVMPLREILAKAEAAYPGQMIEAELDCDDTPPVYKLKMLTTDGRVMKLLYDARNGELLRTKTRGDRR